MPLIGSHEMATPQWAEGYVKQAQAGTWAVARAAPRTVATLGAWAWRASPRLTVAAVATQLAAAVMTALGLLATASVFTGLLAQGPTPQRVLAALPALGVVAAAVAGQGLLQAGVGAARAALIPRIEQLAQDEFYTTLAAVDLLAFDDPDFVALLERASSRGLVSIRLGAEYAIAVLAAGVSMLAAVVAAGMLHPLLGPVVVLTALPLAWGSMRGAQVELASFVRMTSAVRRGEITAELMSRRGNAAEIRALTAQQLLLDEHRRITAELTAELVRVGQRQNVLLIAGRGLGAVGSMAGYAVLGVLLYVGGLPLALAAAAVTAMRTASQAINSGVHAVNELFEIGIYVELYQTCIAESRTRRRPPSSHALCGDPEVIQLTDVSFRYPGQPQDALAGINLTLRRGERIALVGENGSGKSTLAKLITGLYLPTSGSVEWDGISTDKIDPVELHQRIAMVMQEPLRWPVTAENNIRIGRLDSDDPDGARFAAATAGAGADSVLADLPEGEHTVLSRAFQNGRDLSGGQWQRISVARGLYRDSTVVVADEPTSAMDARAEHTVFGALRSLSAGNGDRARITVLITHRLANVRDADSIVVLHEGRVAERGTHDELIATDSRYQQLFTLQAHSYQQ
jgi:ATP-binding cassette subfamily B protein